MSEVNQFGERLRERRLTLGLTLAAVAERAGIHLQSLARIESGVRPNPTWDTVMALCTALDVTPDYFLPPPKPSKRK